MLVSTRQLLSRIDNTDINIYIGDQKLLLCTNINYLGMEIDCTLSWDLQIDILCKKLVFIISKLSRLKAVIQSYLLLLVYTSMIHLKLIMLYQYGVILADKTLTKFSVCKTEQQ